VRKYGTIITKPTRFPVLQASQLEITMLSLTTSGLSAAQL
jgi:hypothetical protein